MNETAPSLPRTADSGSFAGLAPPRLAVRSGRLLWRVSPTWLAGRNAPTGPAGPRPAFSVLQGGLDGLYQPPDADTAAGWSEPLERGLKASAAWLDLQLCLDGHAELQSAAGHRMELRPGSVWLHLYRAGERSTLRIDARQGLSLACLALPGHGVSAALGEGPLPPTLQALCAGCLGRPVSLALAASPPSRQLRRALCSGESAPMAAGLQLRARALESLAQGLSLLDDAERARALLLQRLSAPPGLEELAASVERSPRYLNSMFRSLYGTGFRGCLQRWRIDYARQRLGEGAAQIKDLARELGYGHPQNFVTAFSREVGVPPGTYLQRLQGRPRPDGPRRAAD